ncbi:MAG: hypothetical protein ACLGPM_02835 [Acidobacteriota bacterium]
MPRAVAFLVGFTAAVGQIVLMREALALFNGNELSLGVILAAWLAWTAAGSGLSGWLLRNRPSVRVPAAVVACVWGVSLPLTVWALRESRASFQTVPGELLGLIPLTLLCAACVSAFCLLSGSLFALAAEMVRAADSVAPGEASSAAYLLETAGSAVGGILTSLLLLRVFTSVQIAFVVALLCVFTSVSLLFRSRWWRAVAAAAMAALAVPLLLDGSPHFERATLQRLWPGFDLIASRESPYGRLSVIGTGGLRSIYDNGSILANVPDPAAAEESIHYALLEHPAPRSVLLIGGGMNGSIAEALKHPSIRSLDYVELDPALLAMYRQFFPAEAAQAFSDPRVQIHSLDGRPYLQTTGRQYDVILVAAPDPSSAQLNRFYTAEFFRIAREHLNPGGLLALQLSASEEALSPSMAAFLRCIHRTLEEVFPRVAVIPGASIHFFAAVAPTDLTEDPGLLIARLKNRGLSTLYVREYFLPFRMAPDRMAQMHALLTRQAGDAINTDFHPLAYYFNAVLWSAQFGDRYARLLQAAGNIRFRTVLGAALAVSLVLLLLFAIAPMQRSRARISAAWCVTAGGYALMTLQILLLLTFQALFGYVYRELALMIGMFMAGIAAGSWLGLKRIRGERIRGERIRDERWPAVRALATTQLVLAAAAPLLLGLASLLAHCLQTSGALLHVQALFPVMALLAGVPGGYLFPVASALWLRGGAKSLTTLYALDLAGGCVAALLLTGFLIPLFGLWNAAWLSAATCIPAAVLALRASLPRATTPLPAGGR